MAKGYIFYVDHQFESKKRLTILLFSNNYEVIPLSSIRETLILLQNLPKPNIIITRMHLSDGDADALLPSLKASAALRTIPVIVLASKPTDIDREKVTKQGANAFLPLDGDSTTLLRTIQDNIALHRDDYRKTSVRISGQLARLHVVDLIIKMAEKHGSGMVSIDGSKVMRIYLKEGRIIHARHGITVGKKALFRCLRIAEAAFHFDADELPTDEEPSLEVDNLAALLEEAKASNERLMANFYRYPKRSARLRIITPSEVTGLKLKPQLRAALEIVRRYPRVGNYLDRLNLPDPDCYDILMDFIEKDILELVTERKPVKVITDWGCDLPSNQLQELNVETMPLELRSGKKILPLNSDVDIEALYAMKPKHLEQVALEPLHNSEFEVFYGRIVQRYDCFSIFTSSDICSLFEKVTQSQTKLLEQGVGGKTLLANEMVTFDSHSLSLGLGLVVLNAAKMAAAEAEIETIEERILACIAKMRLLVAVQPNTPLIRKVSSPCLLQWDGRAFQVIEKLGKQDEVHEHLINQVEKRLDPRADIKIAIGHIEAPARADTLKRRLERDLGLAKNISVFPLNPFSGHKFGKGALEVAFFQE